jgi:hypothetical protein
VDELDLDGTDLGPDAGRIGITLLPGKRYVGTWTGWHWRDLDADAEGLHELGFDVLFLLVEDSELEDCRVTDIGEVLLEHGVGLVRFPIIDPTLPSDPLAYRAVVMELLDRIRGGTSVAIACRAGLDRSGMTAACFLREAGIEAEESIDRVHRARQHTLTVPMQQDFVRAWPPT